MNPTVAAAAIGVTGTVIVGVTGYWASVRNTSKTIDLTRTAVDLTRRTVELTEQGQVTDRYTKAIEQLGSDKIDVRIGGTYALERVARDSPRDHPTVMEVLAVFVRQHSRDQKLTSAEDEPHGPARMTRPDVQAAVTVIGRRNPEHDQQRVNLDHAILPGADLTRADLTSADLTSADLAYADLTYADLTEANLTSANLAYANLTSADLTEANLTNATLTSTDLSAHLTSANLTGANLTNANLTRATLTRATLTGANLSANLTGAYLTGANLTRADLTRANLTGADLANARWPADVAVPEGWQRDTGSGRLKRAGTDSGGAPTDPAPDP
jgi:uncharacterized protein YjbI with pentapeptide repeats